jgi:5-formyltetrahydrofolate cyclo-ligase
MNDDEKINRAKDFRNKIQSFFKDANSDELNQKSSQVVLRVLELFKSVRAQSIAGYKNLNDEVDITEILLQVLKLDLELFLPKVSILTNTMVFYKIKNLNTDLSKGSFGIEEPQGELEKLRSEPDLILIPGRVFSTKMQRLGRGKGFYDTYLKGNVHSIKAGVCFEEQLMHNDLPQHKNDILMDYIITDKNIYSAK